MTTHSITETKTTPPQMGSEVSGRGIRLFRNLSIGARLIIGFGILVIITLVVVGLSYLGSDQATANINSTSEVRVPTALASARAQANLLKMLGNVRAYLALGDEEFRQSYNQSRLDFETNLAELEELSPDLGEANRLRLDQLKNTFEDWSEFPEPLFELRDDQLEREPAYRLLATEGIQTGGTVLIELNRLIEAQGRREASAENIELLADMAEFQGSFAAMLSGLRGYVTTRNRIFRGEYEANLDINGFAWNRLNDSRDALTPSQQTILDNIAENREAFLQLPDQMFAVLEGDKYREDLYLFRTEIIPRTERMQQLLADLTVDQQELLDSELRRGRLGLARANQQTLTFGILALIFGIGLAFIFRENIAGPVRRLTGVAEQIGGGDLEAQAQVESGDEIGTLAKTFNNMTNRLRDTLIQVRKEKNRADNLLDVVIPIGVELSSEKDFNRLLEKMLLEAKDFCHADAGILYLRTEDDRLEFVIVRNDTLDMALGGTTGKEGASQLMTPLPLYDKETNEPNHDTLATHVVLTGASANLSAGGQAEGFNFAPPAIFSENNGYESITYLTIPLKDSEEHVIGVLQLINAEDPETGQIIPFDQNLQEMMESFSSLAVAALEAYIREQALKQEIQQLRIEIDEVKRQKEVSKIVDSEDFQDLKAKAESIRERTRRTRRLKRQQSDDPFKPDS